MKVIKLGFFLAVMLAFGLGAVRSSLAATSGSPTIPTNGPYSFEMVGANVNQLTDVPTTAMSGVFTVTAGATSFAVTNGFFTLNDDRNICTASFTGTGTPSGPNITSGTMNLTLSNLSGPNCDVLSPGGTGVPSVLTFYYGIFSLPGNPALEPTHSGMFIEVVDTNTIAVAGEAQKQ